MIIILSLAIALIIHGVYCPPTEEQEIPSDYPLLSCTFRSPYSRLLSASSNYRIECSDEDPLHCRLIERGMHSQIITYRFERATVEFFSMRDKELTLKIKSKGLEYIVTCDFTSLALAQQFYKLVTRVRPSELVHYLRADYLKDSDDIVLAEKPDLYIEGRENHLRIVIKNHDGNPVLIFPEEAVSEKLQHEDDLTKIDLQISINRALPVLYKFDFRTSSRATYLMALLSRDVATWLRQPIGASYNVFK